MRFRTKMNLRLCHVIEPAEWRQDRRGAFTLIEVLLTLALLVIIAGLTWGSLQRPFARQRLHSAVNAVRSQWCEARVDAMKSGHTYAFRYLVHGDRYHLAPQDDTSATDSSSAGQAPAAAPSAAGGQSSSDEDTLGDDPLPPPVDKRLPQGVRFLPGGGGSEARQSSLGASQANDSATETADNGDGWSDPIYFYADGTTSDARLMLATDGHAAMQLLLRGITGSVTVDDTTAMTQ